MGGQRVEAPDGRRWVVRRHWAPRLGRFSLRERARRRSKGITHFAKEASDGVRGDWTMLDIFDDLGLLMLGFGLLFLVGLVVFSVLAIVVEVLLLLLLVLGGLIARFLFRRPWTIEAVADDGDRQTWRVVGWRASTQRLHDIATHLEAGLAP